MSAVFWQKNDKIYNAVFAEYSYIVVFSLIIDKSLSFTYN